MFKSSQTYNPLYDPATDNMPIPSDVQSRLNAPLVDPAGFDPTDEQFLYEVLAKIDQGVIKLLFPDSLLKQEMYEKLDDAKKGKADQNALIILTSLRTIYNLWKANPVPTFQLKNEIHHIRMTKERVEKELGDVYVI